MAETSRREVLIITNGSGFSRRANVKAWKDWADGLPVRIIESVDQLVVECLSKEYTHAWIADGNYTPYPSSFLASMRKKMPEGTHWTVFGVAKPLATRNFYGEKFTTDKDAHDKYGGIRYVSFEALNSEHEWDKTVNGQNVDFVGYRATRLGFPYTVFQLLHNEPEELANKHFHTAKSFYPHVYQHHSRLSILESHTELARMSDTQMFLVIDSDTELLQELVTEELKPWETDSVHVWYTRNPINGLEYGHGGPKAFNRDAFLGLDGETLDVTTSASSKRLIVHKQVVGIHRFNWSPLSTWRTAFREAAKLALALNHLEDGEQWDEAYDRLGIWCQYSTDGDFKDECYAGACAGRDYARRVNSREEVVRINNFDWLESEFNQHYGLTT